MTPLTISPVTVPEADSGRESEKVARAAAEFEALLLEQMLRAARGTGWLSSGEDQAADCAIGLAEQQLALLLGQSGGLGLAGLLASGLRPKTE